MFKEPRQFVHGKPWRRACTTLFDERDAVPSQNHGSDPCHWNSSFSQPRDCSPLKGLIGADQKGSGRDCLARIARFRRCTQQRQIRDGSITTTTGLIQHVQEHVRREASPSLPLHNHHRLLRRGNPRELENHALDPATPSCNGRTYTLPGLDLSESAPQWNVQHFAD